MSITSYGVKGLIGNALDHMTPMSNGLAVLAKFVQGSLIEGQSEKLDFLGAIPAFKTWAETRQASDLPEYDWSLQNVLKESSFDIPVGWAKADKTGLVQDRVNQMSARMESWAGDIVAGLINASESTACFTGENFIADSHSWGDSGTTDNNLTYTTATATPTASEMATAIMEAWEALIGFKDDKGEPLNETMSRMHVVCPVALAGPTLQAITSQMLNTGSGSRDNPVMALNAAGIDVQMLTSPRITLSSKIMVFNSTPETGSAFIVSENPALRRVTSKAEGSDYEHDTHRWAFGAEIVGNGTYGLPGHAVLTTLSD